jgi:hypothetical protein
VIEMDDEKPTPARAADLAVDAGIDADAGGDPACWAALVCPNCGRIPDRGPEINIDGDRCCPNCGEPYPTD